MSTLVFADHVHHLLLDDEFILLDELGDSYIFLDRQQSQDLLSVFWDSEAIFADKRWLISKGILRHSNRRQFISTVHQNGLGIDNYEWRLTRVFRESSVSRFAVLQLAHQLTVVKLRLKYRGLHYALNVLRQLKRALSNVVDAEAAEVHKHLARDAVGAMGSAAAYLPYRVECLESSLALAEFLLRRRVHAEMRIGVQRYDFLAHAWVEVSGVVIGDHPKLPQRLPAILTV
jgi:hypothetical protein